MSGGRRERWSVLLAELAAPAFGPGEYAGQESLVTAGEIRELVRRAGVTATSRVADLCCGTAGPGVLVASETGCVLVGVETEPQAARLACGRAARSGSAARAGFVVGDVLHAPLAAGFDAVMLLETMLGIADKAALVREVRRLLRPGGCFALTLEAGEPLTPAETSALPGGTGIWFTPEADVCDVLAETGFRVRWRSDLTSAHAARTRRLTAIYEGAREEIIAAMGEAFWSEIVAQHRAFAAWMESGRLRKLAIVAERDEGDRAVAGG